MFIRLSQAGFIIALLAISVLAMLPSDGVEVTLGWDKLNHLIAFFVLLALLDSSKPSLPIWPGKVLYLFIYAWLIELVQAYLPTREFSLLDIVADVAGLYLYIALRPSLLPLLPVPDDVTYQ